MALFQYLETTCEMIIMIIIRRYYDRFRAS
jgi:hypothetical protein